MRRWFAILFLLFLPIQLSWAAVSAYCEHEAGAAADHLGHHEHKHQGEVDDESWPKGGGVDVDCSFCHAASCTALPSGTGLPTLDLAIATIRGEPKCGSLPGISRNQSAPSGDSPPDRQGGRIHSHSGSFTVLNGVAARPLRSS